MKKLLQLIVFAFILSTGYAQEKDFFVMKSGDTVRCTINRISEDYLFYSIINTRTRIEMEKIATYAISENQHINDVPIQQDPIYEGKESFEEQRKNRELIESYTNNEKSEILRLSINAGVGYRIARAIDDIPKSYMNQLRWGFSYAAKIQAFDRRDRGLGIEFNQYNSTARGNISPYGNIEDNVTISYFGISFIEREEIADNMGYAEFGLGALFYENNVLDNGNPILIEGVTIGLNLQYSFDISISESFHLTLNTGILAGKLTTVKINGTTYSTQNPEEGEGLARINVGIGLSYRK